VSASGNFQGQLVCCGGPESKVPRSGLKTCFVLFGLGLCFFNFLSVDHFSLAFLTSRFNPLGESGDRLRPQNLGGGGGRQEAGISTLKTALHRTDRKVYYYDYFIFYVCCHRDDVDPAGKCQQT